MKRIRMIRMIKRLPYFVFFTVLLTPWVLPKPCSGQTPSAKGNGNKLTVCIDSPIVSLDPTNYRDRTTQVVLKNMFDSLTTRDSELRVVPQLAESWKALSDTTWEFKLRRGVKFHNGDDFTSADVKFTLDRVVQGGALDGETSPRKSLLEPLSEISIIDEYTVRIQTRKPWAILPLMLTLQEIVPKGYMKEVGSDEFQKMPVGTGPFRFLRKKGRDQLVLERFENYYGGSPKIPPVQPAPMKNLTFEHVPETIERIARLERDECHVITRVPPESVGILSMVPELEVKTSAATRSHFAEINLTTPP